LSEVLINPYRFVVAPEPETYTWNACSTKNDFTLKEGLDQCCGQRITTSNVLIGSQISSLTLKLRRRGTNSTSGTVYVEWRATDDSVKSTSDGFPIPNLGANTDYDEATEVTFTFSSKPTVADDDYFLVLSDLVYDTSGSPEVWFNMIPNGDCTDYTNWLEYKGTSSPPILEYTGADIIGTAEYLA